MKWFRPICTDTKCEKNEAHMFFHINNAKTQRKKTKIFSKKLKTKNRCFIYLKNLFRPDSQQESQKWEKVPLSFEKKTVLKTFSPVFRRRKLSVA